MSDPPVDELPPYRIEPARSGRSKCKACRRPIAKDTLRFGFLIEGPFGQGYLWHHMNCAARRFPDRIEQAYEKRAWDDGVDVPPIEKLRALAEKAERTRSRRKTAPYAERAPTGRAACKTCGEPIAKDAFRVVVLRRVEFGGQVRHGAVHVHPACVAHEIDREDSAIEPDELAAALRRNSEGMAGPDLDAIIAEIGTRPPGQHG